MIDKISGYLIDYANRMKPEVTIFRRLFIEGINSYIEAVSITREFGNEEMVVEAINTLHSLRKSFNDSIFQLSTFKNTIKKFPKLTTRLFVSKNEAERVLDELLKEMKSGLNILDSFLLDER